MIAKKSLALTATAAIAAYVGLWISGVLSPYYFAAVMQEPKDADAFRLLSPDMKVEIEARPIEGLTQNLSGLTYSDITSTLFAVVNNPALIVELSVDGQLLRVISLKGVRDPEGIAHMDGTRFFIVDEADQSLHLVNIDTATKAIVIEDRPALVLGYDFHDNMGFEGVSWDAKSRRLYLAQEMMPIRVLAVDGLDQLGDQKAQSIVVKSWDLPWLHSIKLMDVSSNSLHDASGHLLLLSHQSRMMLEYDIDARLIGKMALNAGEFGLKDSIAQAEGLAIGPNGEIFVVAEPNLFFRFSTTGMRSNAASLATPTYCCSVCSMLQLKRPPL